jgi:hypothetical protein
LPNDPSSPWLHAVTNGDHRFLAIDARSHFCDVWTLPGSKAVHSRVAHSIDLEDLLVVDIEILFCLHLGVGGNGLQIVLLVLEELDAALIVPGVFRELID